MIIHEYQGKELLREMGVPTPGGKVAHSPQEAGEITRELGKKVAVKAQVHIGGRGKAGGIKLADSAQEAVARAQEDEARKRRRASRPLVRSYNL